VAGVLAVATFPRIRLVRDRVPDAEHVERVRRTLHRFDRWRPWMAGFYTALAVGYVALLVAAVTVLNGFRLQAQDRPALLGLFVGLGVGASLGLLGAHIADMLCVVFLGARNERLLVRYFDAVTALRGESADEPRPGVPGRPPPGPET
jgi:hypothetical protein